MFLEIACFFVGESKNFTIQVLKGFEIFPEDGFQRLEDIGLLKCGRGFRIVMHDILKQMGREIVRQENVDYPGKRSRLWNYKDALKVLKNCEVRSTLANFSLTFDVFFLYFLLNKKHRENKEMANKGN